MSELGKLWVTIGARTEQLESALKSVGNSLEKHKEQFRKIGLGMTAAGAAMTAFFAKAVQEAGAQEKAMAKLSTAIKNVEGPTSTGAEKLAKYAQELQKLTGYSDEQIMTAQSMLGTFMLTSDQIAAITPRLLDMAAATEGATGEQADLQAIAIALGKAFTGQQGQLARYGVVLSEQAKQTGNFNLILQDLDKNFKGQAETIGQTWVGQVRKAKAAWGDVLEIIGAKLIPVLTPLVQKLAEVAEKIGVWIDRHEGLVKVLVPAIAGLGALMAVLGPIVMVLPQLVTGIGALTGALGGIVGPAGLVMAALAAIALAIRELVKTHKAALDDMTRMAKMAMLDIETNGYTYLAMLKKVQAEGGKSLEQWKDLVFRFGADYVAIFTEITTKPEYAKLKTHLDEIMAKQKGLKGSTEDLIKVSIELPKPLKDIAREGKLVGDNLGKAEPPVRGIITVMETGAPAARNMARALAEFSVVITGTAVPAARNMDAVLADIVARMPQIPAVTGPAKEAMRTFAQEVSTVWSDAMRNVARAITEAFGIYKALTYQAQAFNDQYFKKAMSDVEAEYKAKKAYIEANITDEEERAAALDKLNEWYKTECQRIREDEDRARQEHADREEKRQQALWNKVKGIFGTAVEEMLTVWLTRFISTLITTSTKAASEAASSLSSAIADTGKTIAAVGQGLGAAVVAIAQGVATAAKIIAGAAKEILIAAAIALAIKSAFEIMSGIIKSIFGGDGESKTIGGWIHESRNFLADIRNMMDWVNKSLDTIKGILWERFDWLVGSVNDTRYQFGPQFDTANGYLRTIAEALSNLSGYQHGGVALHPQLAQVGEVPEAIIPLDQFSGLRGPQIIFNLSAVDGRNMERWLKATGAKAICEIVQDAFDHYSLRAPVGTVRG